MAYAIARKAGVEDQDVASLLEGVTEMRLQDWGKKPLGKLEPIAIAALRDRSHDLKYDIKKSPIATRLLEAFGAAKVNEVHALAEKYLGEKMDNTQVPPKPTPLQPEQFLSEAADALGADKVDLIRKAMIAAIRERAHLAKEDGTPTVDGQNVRKLEAVSVTARGI